MESREKLGVEEFTRWLLLHPPILLIGLIMVFHQVPIIITVYMPSMARVIRGIQMRLAQPHPQ